MQVWIDNATDILASIADFFTSGIGYKLFSLVIFVAVCEVTRQLIRRRFRK